MGLYWLLSPTNPLLLSYETRDSYNMVTKIRIMAIATFLMIVGAHVTPNNYDMK
jgi:hypothetical protein